MFESCAFHMSSRCFPFVFPFLPDVSMVTDLTIVSFFFFKQKTAYDMRISDWSSDVCSSDLQQHRGHPVQRAAGLLEQHAREIEPPCARGKHRLQVIRARIGGVGGDRAARDGQHRAHPAEVRSEEHTSELQSLMRISYAVFCLKKKKKHVEPMHRTSQPNT